jgi:hypothetical protein
MYTFHTMQRYTHYIILTLVIIGMLAISILYFLNHGVGPGWSAIPAWDATPRSQGLPP